MAVTTKGRVICWKEEVFQFKPPQKKYKGYIWIDYIFVQLMWAIAKCFIVMFCPGNKSSTNTLTPANNNIRFMRTPCYI